MDVHHELAYPYEVLARVIRALKPGGRVAFGGMFARARRGSPGGPVLLVQQAQ